MTYENLKELQDIDIHTVELETLVDIKDIKIDTNLPKEERIEDFLRQIRNPYCFRCGKLIIKISNMDALEKFEEKLKSYIEFME